MLAADGTGWDHWDALLGGGGSTLLGESCLDALRTLEGKYDLTESEKRMMAQAPHRQTAETDPTRSAYECFRNRSQ